MIVLPAASTDAGVEARLFILEAMDPSNPFYNLVDAKRAMEWMKLVLVNRLANQPGQFMAAGAKTVIGIVKAPGQFSGFSHYPILSASLTARLDLFKAIADNPKDPRSFAYAAFIKTAILVATAKPIADPARADHSRSLGLMSWRTEGTGGPGPRFVKFRSLAGNTFYSLLK